MEYIVAKYYNAVGKVGFRFGELNYVTQRFKDEGRRFDIVRSASLPTSIYETQAELEAELEDFAKMCYENYSNLS